MSVPRSDGPARSAERAASYAELMRKVSEADRNALGEIYDRLGPDLYALIRRRGLSAADAEPVLELCFLDLWRTAPRAARAGARPETWVLAAVDHAIGAVDAKER